MKKLTFITLLFLTIALSNCDILDNNNNTTQQEDLDELKAQKTYILSLISSANCSSNSQCNYVALGSKPCGGPWSYLVYPTSMDTKLLLEQVTMYNLKEDNYNKKWNVISDCSFAMPPTRVDCINNKCVAVYGN